MNGALLHHDLRVQWRSRSSVILQCAVSLIFLLLIGQLWSGQSFTSTDIDLRGRELFSLLGFVVALMTMIWTPLAGVRLLTGGRSNSAMSLALQTPASKWSIVRERYVAWLMHALLPAMISLPVSMACYTVGSVDLYQVLLLYLVIGVLSAKLVAFGMLFACRSVSNYSALCWTYGIVFLVMILSIVPEVLVSIGSSISSITFAKDMSLLSPTAAIMQAVRIGGRQVVEQPALIYILAALTCTGVCLFLTTAGLNTETLLVTRGLPRRCFGIIPRSRKLTTLANPRTKRNLSVSRYRMLLGALFIAAVVIGFAGSRNPTVETNAALAALLVKISMFIVVLGAPGLVAAIITQYRHRGYWQVVGMTRLTSIELVIPKVFCACIILVLMLIALMPMCLVISHLDITNTWSTKRFLGILVMFVLVVVSWSAMVGSFLNRPGQSYVAAYVTVLILCVLIPLVAFNEIAPEIINIEVLKNFCPPLLVLDALALDHEPEYQMSANIVPFFTTVSLVCLIMTVARVWRMRVPG